MLYYAFMQPELVRTIDVFLECTKKPLIVILGPTAGGKTGFSIEIAKHVDGEIVNSDSRQLYKYLDIGTAKITKDEMQGVQHHLIDVYDPKEEVAVGMYQEEALKIIEDIILRGKVPILVGGSMLYISSITDGLSLAPVADSRLRERLIGEYDRDCGASLYRRLQKIDPDTASNIHQNNKPRIVRAIEIYEILKSPKSKMMSEKGELRPRFGNSGRCSYDCLIFGVDQGGENLKRRIVERLEQMFESGWIDEVRDLLLRGYTSEDPGLKSCGYREIIKYLQEVESAGSDMDTDSMKEKLKERIAAKTRQYAKRQMTWWRGDKRIKWVHL